MKKIFAILLALTLLISFSACENDKTESKPSNSTQSDDNKTDSTSSDTQDETDNDTQNPNKDETAQNPNEDSDLNLPVEKVTYSLFMTNTFNDDGSIPFDIIACDCIQFFEDEKYLVNSEDGIIFDFEIPEKVIYDKITQKFVFSEDDWNAFKQKGSYNLRGPETATYENGVFKYRRIDGWGGWDAVEYKMLDYSDNNSGLLAINYQAIPEEGEAYKVTVTYKYDKAYNNAEFTVIKPNDEYYFGAISSTNKSFVNSLRINSIKKLSAS